MKRTKVAMSRAACVGLMVAVIGTTGVRPALAAPPWSKIMKTFKPGWDPNSSNVCVRGDIACVEAVVAEMKRRNEPLMNECSHNAVFSLLYLRTTQHYLKTVKANPNYFINTPLINHEDALFALYYFRAFDNYKAGNMDGVPSAWKIAFDSAKNKGVTGAGNLLLGVSAHINRDLPYVLDSIGAPKRDDNYDGYKDHNKVNTILREVQPKALKEAADRLDPTIDDIQANGTDLDDDGLFQIVRGWRENAWQDAQALTDAQTKEARAVVAAGIENSAEGKARAIKETNTYPPTTNSASRDAYCLERRTR